MWQQLVVYSATLWVCCMVCHGELVRSKPAPQYATLFYLMVSAGGAVGGMLVALVAPLVLRGLLGVSASAWWPPWFWPSLATLASAGSRAGGLPRLAWIGGGHQSASVGLGPGRGRSTLPSESTSGGETKLETTRNFYGVLRVNPRLRWSLRRRQRPQATN